MIKGIVIKGVGGAYTVATDKGSITCKARGLLRKQKITPLPGDYVQIENDMLHTVLPRKNELLRPRSANMDQVIVTMAAAQPAFERGLLDRFLLLAEYAGIPPVICINKWDLKPDKAPYEAYESTGYTLLYTSHKDGMGMEGLQQLMQGKTSVFAGPSGAGKSSLITWLSGVSQQTGELSAKIDRGKHTTRHTELIPLCYDHKPSGFCVDTPGFTSLDISMIPAASLASLFREFVPFIGQCKFNDCRHDKENACAVKHQVGTSIHPARYESYINFLAKTKI
jgi:ribosome biogenesis GTPase